MKYAGRVLLRPVAAALALVAGLLLYQLGLSEIARAAWTASLWVLGLWVVGGTLRGMVEGRFAADLVAGLAIVTALLLQQPFAGLIIVLMQTGGEALEQYASGRASAAVRELEAQAPRLAHRQEGDRIYDLPADQIEVGESLLVRPGELVPCDGVVESGASDVDVSRLTGEPLPVRASRGTLLRSGSLNLDGPLVLRVTARAEASLYARIVELVRTAQASKAPLQRIADRYAVWFTPFTLLAALIAYLISNDPLRVLAVLVVATPCPLILATPVAIVGGLNRAARRQIIVRHGGALEALAAVDAAVFDKTGTLTIGRPAVEGVEALPPFSEGDVLRLAGAVEQGSGHLLARTLVESAEGRGVTLPPAVELKEAPGRGIWGKVEGHSVTVGALSLVRERHPEAASLLHAVHNGQPALRAYVSIDNTAGGIITYADRIRPGAAEVVRELRRLGFKHLALLSGDRKENAAAVAQAVGITEVAADLLPQEKVAHIQALARDSHRVLMIGDGTNDAPALSSATVGLALATHGGGRGIAAEAADVVLLADDLHRIPEAVQIGRRTLRIARQSIVVGLGLSAAGMVAAALGHLSPVAGALFQETVDVAVIVNALRSAGSGKAR